MNKINVIDLFSGCGGLSYGLLNEGFDVLLGIDNNPVSLKTFQYNHLNSPIIASDITKITKANIESAVDHKKIHLVVGGPPCQGFSLSGPRNFNDPRNQLFLSFMRIVKELKPQAFLMENVPGMIGLYGGQIKSEIIHRFSLLGYTVSYKVVLAADYGVPQLRKRVIFVGLLGKNQAFEFPEPYLKNSDYATCREAIGDLPSLENDLGQEPCVYLKKDRLTNYQKLMRRGMEHVHNHVGTQHSDKTRRIIALVPEGGNYKDLPVKYRNSRNFHVAWTRFHGNKPAPTIDTGHRHHFHYEFNRVPTVRESARLQSFPDKFIFFGNKSQQYAQTGNAVPPLMAQALGKKLKTYL